MQPERKLLIVGQREAAPPPIYDPLGDEAGLTVLRCSKLSAADKLAWGFLRVRCESGRRQAKVHPRDLAEHQGVTSDAGRQRLKNLKQAGLIVVFDVCRRTGSWTLSLLDPRDVLTDAPRVVPGDPQLVLPFLADESADSKPPDQAPSESLAAAAAGDAPSWSGQSPPAAGEASGPPPASYTALRVAGSSEEPRPDRGTSGGSSGGTSVAPSGLLGLSGPSERASSLNRPLTIGRPSGPSADGLPPVALAAEEPRRGTSGGSSAPTDQAGDAFAAEVARRQQQLGVPSDGGQRDWQVDAMAVRAAAAIGAATAWRMPSPEELATRREQWIGIIRRRVRDPQLKACVMVKVAQAVVSGELKPDYVEEVFQEIDNHRRQGTLRAPAGAYFLRAAQALFRRHGLEWTGYASGGRRKPR